MAPSSCRDRTAEFLSIVDRARRSQASSSSSFDNNGGIDDSVTARLLHSDPARSAVSLHSEFNKRASRIGLSIHQTSQKLSKLTKLIKRTSLFEDPTAEINDLTAVIKEDISALNAAISDLHTLCNSQKQSGSQTKQSSDHSVTVVDNLKSRLMSATKEFSDVLSMRSESLKAHDSRRQLYNPNVPKDKNPFVRQRPVAANHAGVSSSAPPWANGSTNMPPWANGSTSSASPFSSSRRLKGEDGAISSASQQAMQQMVPLQDSYMQSRAEALQNVESTILELGGIFQQLATMVAQQGEIALRIDENMDDTLANVEGAQGALLKYLNSISSNRWLILKIFFVLIVFLLIFVVFIA